jgi:hypothetical protein
MKNFLLLFLVRFILATKKSPKQNLLPTILLLMEKIDEAAWETVPVATDFIMFQPDNGKPFRMPKNNS